MEKPAGFLNPNFEISYKGDSVDQIQIFGNQKINIMIIIKNLSFKNLSI